LTWLDPVIDGAHASVNRHQAYPLQRYPRLLGEIRDRDTGSHVQSESLSAAPGHAFEDDQLHLHIPYVPLEGGRLGAMARELL